MTTRRKKKRDWGNLDLSALDGEAFVILVGLAVAALLGWLIVELVVPVVVVWCYVLLLAALRRASRDRHDCAGHLGRALVWGIVWATVYTLPLALIAVLVHAVLAS